MTLTKTDKLLVSCLLIVIMAFSLSLAEEESLSLYGEWCYDYAPEAPVVILEEGGSASFLGTSAHWEAKADESLLLFYDASDRVQAIRYAMSDKGLILYLPVQFTKVSETERESVVGTWKAGGTSQSSFVFTQNGRFLEDGVFTGSYSVNEEASQVTLHYTEYFEDTTFYYSFIDDDTLIIAYPWTFVRK